MGATREGLKGRSRHTEENVWRGASLRAKKRRLTKVKKGLGREREEWEKRRGWELVKESEMSEGWGVKERGESEKGTKGCIRIHSN